MKVLRVWNDMSVNNYWQNFHFWVNYLFKVPVYKIEEWTGVM